MAGNIFRFKIENLHGIFNYNIKLKDNKLILVGENGSGKTTILRLIYYLLSGQWASLTQYQFTRLTLSINNIDIPVNRRQLTDKFGHIKKNYLRNFPVQIRKKIYDIIENSETGFDVSTIEQISDRFDIPISMLYEEIAPIESIFLKDKELKKQLQNIETNIDAQVLYLPTYRRIEQELNLIFSGFEVDEWSLFRKRLKMKEKSNSIELIEFGMQDVKSAINNTLEELKEFARKTSTDLTLGYLGEVVDQKYLEVNVEEIKNTTEEIVDSVLTRIGENILSNKQKNHIQETINIVRKGETATEHAQVICHYFLKLLNLQTELSKKESKISDFCKVCNQYLVDKKIIYNSSNFTYMIESNSYKQLKEIELHQLSSGEKQIVSLFSHLYLSNQDKFFLLIDEPELSLSVPWQRKFLLDICNASFFSGLIAVTHSPFIYENELESYTFGLGEFLE